MNIGSFYPQWSAAARAAGHDVIDLPSPPNTTAPPDQEIQRLTTAGQATLDQLSGHSIELLIDDAARGLQFARSPITGNHQLLHEVAGVPLNTRFVDPIASCLSRLPIDQAFQCLGSINWRKFVWDRVQADEMEQFGIPHVFHLPMAAELRDYDTRPLDLAAISEPVSFVGTPVGGFFSPNRQVETSSMVPGMIAHFARATNPELTFYDVYHDLYRMAEPPLPDEPMAERIQKLHTYLRAKIFYAAAALLRQRDRFVIFMQRQLENEFHLYGNNWQETYGLTAHSPLSNEQYLPHFRRSLININLNSGHAESGINLRTFEITAAGGFLLSQHQPELEECFELGVECDSFNDERELLEKCRFYMAHPERAAEMALAGQQRTLREHMYTHRLERVLQVHEQLKNAVPVG